MHDIMNNVMRWTINEVKDPRDLTGYFLNKMLKKFRIIDKYRKRAHKMKISSPLL